MAQLTLAQVATRAHGNARAGQEAPSPETSLLRWEKYDQARAAHRVTAMEVNAAPGTEPLRDAGRLAALAGRQPQPPLGYSRRQSRLWMAGFAEGVREAAHGHRAPCP
jgi:hypothetical protein